MEERLMDHVTLFITFDPTLVSPEFMAEHIQELEGVESVEVGETD
jgi:hypothetical protein